MKRLLLIILGVFIIGSAGCSDKVNDSVNPATENDQIISEEMTPENKSPEDMPTENMIPEDMPSEQTVPLHSDLYISDYTQSQILSFFEEVVLNMEYSDGTGDASVVQKWQTPVYYSLYGSYTDADISKLNELFVLLNEIDGFPGIYPATEDNYENLSISFLGPDEFTREFSEVINGEDAYGAAQFWYYTETNEIHTARIGYRTDIDQDTRSSIIPEEIINMLGISDTEIRTDSIVYQYSNENTVLSDVDILILQLLYDPKIEIGMNYDSCKEMIKELYY